ncbi:cysteine desulfurase [Paenibacillus spiritus]|uniref:Cysteine desulfurase n=1 Tax=Paenibacillus spiritus TaxID=2496557 RepID=A0A5J5GIU7_9BACL|nr:cysteine desulfurase family protein [Paenibacillus spiritus]KAA9007628.1 cysteine desulfurase [Paenibacillus spiritus]
MIYWDYAAAAPPYEEVVRTMGQLMPLFYANPASLHGEGRRAAELLERARSTCAAALRAQPEEILFTSGATESNNLAVKGAARHPDRRGRHLVTSRIEHPSVYESFVQLANEGWEVTVVDPQADGSVTPEAVAAAVRPDTALVSIMQVNNETGALQPSAGIGRAIRAVNPRTLYHVDGVQGFGRVPGVPADWDADLYSLSAHKLRGPRGAGLLYVRRGVRLAPLLAGGGQEGGLRAGTENVPALVAASKAVRLAAENGPAEAARLRPLRDRLARFVAGLPELRLISPMDGAPHIVHFVFPGMKGEVMARQLEALGMIVSTRSACSSKTAEPSRVLLAMGLDRETAQSGVRISLGAEHTEADVAALEQAIARAVAELKPAAR